MKYFLNCRYSLVLMTVLVLFPFINHAQLSDNSLPESFLSGLKNATLMPAKQLDSVGIKNMLKSDRESFIDNRYGMMEPCHIDIKKDGVRTEIGGKGTIWQYRVSSADAYSLGLYFKNYYLPPLARLYIFNPNQSQLRGAFTNRNNHASARELTLAEFPGKDIIIEYFEPLSPEFPGELVLGGVSQAYLDIDSLKNKTLGINCPEGQDWKDQKNSVCLMTYHDRLYSYFCTGTLVNNVKLDLKPYFLTAFHCIRNELMANSLVAYFNYENSLCDSYDASTSQTLAGATLKATSQHTDFALLLLEENPPEEFQPFYAGWDARGVNPLQGACIHHPHGSTKALAIDTLKILSYPYKAQWYYDGMATKPNTHWWANFTSGFVEMGSSGAPLFDQNKRVTGQLHGGANDVFLFGKLSLSWDYNPDDAFQLAHWLDPDSTGQKVMDGTWRIAPTAKFRAEVQRVCPNLPVSFFDESTMDPVSWEWKISPSTYSFVEGTDSTSQHPRIIFRGEGFYSVTLKVTNSHGCDEKLEENYIYSKTKLDVKLVPVGDDNVVCGCDLNSFPIVAQNSILYDFTVGKLGEFEVKHVADTLFLTLNPAITQSFDAWVKIVRPNKYCIPNDSMLLHILIPPNDSIRNAVRLHPGLNEGYTNRCATVEKNEPHPYSVNCTGENSWCRSLGNDYTVLDNSVWFTFIAPSNGKLTLDSNGFDNQIAVYEAYTDSNNLKSTPIRLKLIAANDDRSPMDNTALIRNLGLQPGKEYYLQVDGNNAAHGQLGILLLNNTLEIHPNPSNGLFRIIIPNTDPGIAEVLITTLDGRKIFSNSFRVIRQSNSFPVDLTHCSKGIYLLNVRINGSFISKKIMIW